MAITHTKVSGIADGGDASLVRPSDWNAAHTVANDSITYAMIQNVSAGDKVLGRITGAGDAEEIACTAAGRALLDDADAAAQLTTLGVSAFVQTILNDADAAAVRSTIGVTGMTTMRTTGNQTINAGAGVFTDITGLTFAVVNGTDYAFEFYITFQSAATATGWKAGVNCPAGTLDFWAGSDVIANGAAGVATHTERHNTARDDMTLLTTTVTQAVDLNVRIKGRYLCTADGTFAARFANESVTNTDIVVQKGSWGWWF